MFDLPINCNSFDYWCIKISILAFYIQTENMFEFLNIDVLINCVLAIIMFGLGLTLTIKDFKNIFAHPGSLITALFVQLFIVPAIAFLLASWFDMPDEAKVGMVIVSICASGASSNLITHLFKGNVALAISMTTINSLITLISIPLIANFALSVFMGKQELIQLPVFDTLIRIFSVTIVPAFIGIIIRIVNQRIAKVFDFPLRIILPLLLCLVFTIKIFWGEESGGTGITFNEVVALLPALLLLNVFAMVSGFIAGKIIKLPFADSYTISIEVGLHNTSLALLISGTILHNAGMEKPAVVYAMFSFFTAILFVLIIKRFFKKTESIT